MRPGARLAVFAVAAVGVFAASFAAGRAVEPVGLSNAEPVEHGGAMEMAGGLPGLASTAEGFALVPTSDTQPPGRPAEYRFTIRGEDGAPVTVFDEEHTKRMHLIVVRRDFAGFIHEHPVMGADGTWTATLNIAEAGVYRVFADFVVDGDKHTLGADLFVPGSFDPIPLAAPKDSTAIADGYEVDLDAEIVAGEESELSFTIRRGGQLVADIPDYLGAKGHLVALRGRDLAYLHVHADEDRLSFAADFPSPGTYRLFIQFEHGGQVRTASFTINAEEASR